MIGKKALIGAGTGAAAAGLWWAGITPTGESRIHPVPILGGAVSGALAGMVAHDQTIKTVAVGALAGVGGGAVAQYIKLKYFSE